MREQMRAEGYVKWKCRSCMSESGILVHYRNEWHEIETIGDVTGCIREAVCDEMNRCIDRMKDSSAPLCKADIEILEHEIRDRGDEELDIRL